MADPFEQVVEATAQWLMRNAGLLERPGYQRHDQWYFEDWSQLREDQREPWRKKARALFSHQRTTGLLTLVKEQPEHYEVDDWKLPDRTAHQKDSGHHPEGEPSEVAIERTAQALETGLLSERRRRARAILAAAYAIDHPQDRG